MEKYIFETKDGKSRVTDTETGVTVEYENGHFNDVQNTTWEPTDKLNSDTPAPDFVAILAHACKGIGDYVLNNHPETI